MPSIANAGMSVVATPSGIYTVGSPPQDRVQQPANATVLDFSNTRAPWRMR